MLKKFLKTKTLSFLMSLAAVCPVASAKESSDKYCPPVDNLSQPLDNYSDTIDINGTNFYIPHLNEKEPVIQAQTNKTDSTKAQTLDVDGIKFIIPEQDATNHIHVVQTKQDEISDDVKEKNAILAKETLKKLDENGKTDSQSPAQQDLADIIDQISSIESTADETKTLSPKEASSQNTALSTVTQADVPSKITSEKRKKYEEEAKNLLEKLENNPIDAQAGVSSELTEVLALSNGTSKEEENTLKQTEDTSVVVSEKSNLKPQEIPSVVSVNSEKTLTNEVASAVSNIKSETSSNATTSVENVVATIAHSEKGSSVSLPKIEPSNSINSSNSLDSLDELISEIEGKQQEPQETCPKKISFESHSKITKAQEIMYVCGGIGFTYLLLASVLFLPKLTKKKRPLRKKAYTYDDFATSEILSEVISNPSSSQEQPVQTSSQKNNANKSEEETIEKESPIISENKEETSQDKNISGSFSSSEDMPQDTSNENLLAHLYLLGLLDKAKEEREQCAELWWSMKKIDEITQERTALRRKMAAAKKQNNTEEIEAIKARRKILTAKRREACFRANRKEMLAIKEERRLLTKQMTIARRKKDVATMEKIAAIRFSIKEHLKSVNAEIKAFDYKKERLSYLKALALTRKQFQKTL